MTEEADVARRVREFEDAEAIAARARAGRRDEGGPGVRLGTGQESG